MRYIPARNHGPASNAPIIRIVEHGTVGPCKIGAAYTVARMFQTTSRDASTQYVTDPGEVIRCLPDNVVGYGAPPNTGSIHRELCDIEAGSPARWQDPNHQAMLRLAAADDARLAKLYKIPVRHLSVADLRRGAKGFCSHLDVTNAWHQTDHVDPRDFPWKQYLGMVKAAMKNPAPPVGDDDMPEIIAGSDHTVQDVVANVWKVLRVGLLGANPTPSMVAGPRRVEGTISVYLDEPCADVTLNAYLAAMPKGGSGFEVVDTAGSQDGSGAKLQVGVSKTVLAGQLLRVRILAPADCKVTYIRHDFSTWKV